MGKFFDLIIENRGYSWRCLGAILESGVVDIVEVYLNKDGRQSRVMADSVKMMAADELLTDKIKEAVNGPRTPN